MQRPQPCGEYAAERAEGSVPDPRLHEARRKAVAWGDAPWSQVIACGTCGLAYGAVLAWIALGLATEKAETFVPIVLFSSPVGLLDGCLGLAALPPMWLVAGVLLAESRSTKGRAILAAPLAAHDLSMVSYLVACQPFSGANGLTLWWSKPNLLIVGTIWYFGGQALLLATLAWQWMRATRERR